QPVTGNGCAHGVTNKRLAQIPRRLRLWNAVHVATFERGNGAIKAAIRRQIPDDGLLPLGADWRFTLRRGVVGVRAECRDGCLDGCLGLFTPAFKHYSRLRFWVKNDPALFFMIGSRAYLAASQPWLWASTSLEVMSPVSLSTL